MVGGGRTIVATLAGAVLWASVSAGAQAAVGDWRVGVPVFTPKSGTSFTLLFTNFQPASRQFLIRRYDAVGTLLTSQSVTIGANATLQASPSAHSGAPLSVQLWSEAPGLAVRTTYTDSDNVSRVIEPASTVTLGPAGVSATAFDAGLETLQSRFSALQSPLDTLQSGVTAVSETLGPVRSGVSSVAEKVGGLESGVSSANTKLDALSQSTSGSSGGTTTVAADPQVAALRKDVTKLRKQVRGLRKLLVRALKRRG